MSLSATLRVPPQPAPENGRPNAEEVKSSSRSIFISYKREEFAYANRLRLALEKAGYHVWWDKELQTGGTWAAELDQELVRAHCVIVLWSRRAAKSSWVRHEASMAMGRASYLPVKIEALDVPDPFSRIQAAELMGWDGRRHHSGFEAVLESITRFTKKEPGPAELDTDDRWPAWPARVPRNAVIRTALWTKQHLAMLAAALALVVLASVVLATSDLVQKLHKQVEIVTRVVGPLRAELQGVRKATAEIAQEQERVVRDLAAQLDAGAGLAQDLHELSVLAKDEFALAQTLRNDNLKQEDFLGLRVVVAFRRGDLKDANGELVLPDLTWEALRTNPLRVDRSQVDSAQAMLLKDLDVSVRVCDRNRPVKSAQILLKPDDNVGEKPRIWRDGDSGEEIISFAVSYRVRLRELLRVRSFEEYPGSTIEVGVKSLFHAFRPSRVHFDLGMLAHDPPAVNFAPGLDPWVTSATAELQVPEDYLAVVRSKARPH